jgi:hypothetical protein
VSSRLVARGTAPAAVALAARAGLVPRGEVRRHLEQARGGCCCLRRIPWRLPINDRLPTQPPHRQPAEFAATVSSPPRLSILTVVRSVRVSSLLGAGRPFLQFKTESATPQPAGRLKTSAGSDLLCALAVEGNRTGICRSRRRRKGKCRCDQDRGRQSEKGVSSSATDGLCHRRTELYLWSRSQWIPAGDSGDRFSGSFQWSLFSRSRTDDRHVDRRSGSHTLSSRCVWRVTRKP